MKVDERAEKVFEQIDGDELLPSVLRDRHAEGGAARPGHHAGARGGAGHPGQGGGPGVLEHVARIDPFNEMRVPALTYGPGISVGGGTFGMKIADMVTGTRLYALTALDLCDEACG
jgi:hypothetical protein